ncbi:hypothetical protein BU25DRAFT_415205 [Macroventuria anomochaeta]|uniref:Uncharacterized protein n=1 Tax=Macroventuria anomochaeta TaxID=301207 RepID=A0ACB6RKJ7_9PLEO|nr:uncharacterized protein BU25DRAFT_415205 [Macroventuria anomochaeta]KAF2622475.1 hypothetical protein BU25DRAFT_415205 [Macroventuria anomochaeta]
MSKILSEADEYRVRQLEPVVEMFIAEWTLAESPPPGVPPIDTGDKWAYQKNGCPACMLARIGSDEGALFAIFAGMNGHHRSRSGGQKGVDKIKSKRLRFVRYWMHTHTNGDQAAQDAYDLGVELRELHRDAKSYLRRSRQPTQYTRDSLDEVPVTARHCLDDQEEACLDISDPYNPKDWTTNTHDPNIGPIPPLDPTIPTIIEGWNNKPVPDLPRASILIQSPTPHFTKSTHSFHAVHTIENDTLAPLPLLSHANLKRRDSVLGSSGPPIYPPRPASSIYSSPSRLTLATSIASYNNPTSAPHQTRTQRYDPMESLEERLDKYRNMMARTSFERKANKGEATMEFQGRLLPKPSRVSMYSAFGEEEHGGEEFKMVHVTPPPSPGFEGIGEEYAEDKWDGDDVDVVPDALRPQKRG